MSLPTWIDPELEKLYLFTKLLLKYLPRKQESLPKEIIDMDLGGKESA